MALEILSSLRPQLANAHRIVETIVLRSHVGTIYTISVGESLLSEKSNALGAKVTLLGDVDTHIGICDGASMDEVLNAAQELIAASIKSGASQTAVPKPHTTPARKGAPS